MGLRVPQLKFIPSGIRAVRALGEGGHSCLRAVLFFLCFALAFALALAFAFAFLLRLRKVENTKKILKNKKSS
jgi:hypothetical protein